MDGRIFRALKAYTYFKMQTKINHELKTLRTVYLGAINNDDVLR